MSAASDDFAATVVSLPPSGVDLRLGAPDSAIDSMPADLETLPGTVPPEPGLGHIGRYELQRTLGTGGLGAVYEAHDPLLSRTVAVKTLQFDAPPGARVALDRLFLNEARAAAGLSHPHIVTVFDAGLSAHGVYIAMERLRGRDMRQALAEGWRPTPAQAVLLARRVADALAYAHARGVVHCDIKPANIFLSRSGKPKLLDFGIARIVRRTPGATGGAGEAPAPLDGMVAGSPHYLAPEQLRGEAVDGRTDVYALAVVLYELLTGRKAFVGASLEAIHAAVLAHAPTPADEVDPTLPAGLALLLSQAMSRDPAARPASAAEFAQALRPWHDGLDTAARGKPPAAAAIPPGRADAQAGPGDLAPVRRRRRAWPALAVAGVLAATTAVVVLGFADGDIDAGAGGPPAAGLAAPAAGVPEAATSPVASLAPAAVATGRIELAIHPRGEIEVDGNPAGSAAPTATLTLPEGPHLVIVRLEGHPAFIAEVNVQAGTPVRVAHRFGR